MDKEWYEMNAKLQMKKSALRSMLVERGMLKREGNNTFDKYKYFTEAQYKLLFNELFSTCSLELKCSEISYDTFDGTEKQANGRMVKLKFTLFDVESGFFEESVITGEGIDKGDKAGYKAYTGALKYYLADNFMVATGDDPETESPDYKMNRKNKTSDTTLQYIIDHLTTDQLKAVLNMYSVNRLDEIPPEGIAKIVNKINKNLMEAQS